MSTMQPPPEVTRCRYCRQPITRDDDVLHLPEAYGQSPPETWVDETGGDSCYIAAEDEHLRRMNMDVHVPDNREGVLVTITTEEGDMLTSLSTEVFDSDRFAAMIETYVTTIDEVV